MMPLPGFPIYSNYVSPKHDFECITHLNQLPQPVVETLGPHWAEAPSHRLDVRLGRDLAVTVADVCLGQSTVCEHLRAGRACLVFETL